MRDFKSAENLQALLEAYEKAGEEKMLREKLTDLANKSRRTSSVTGDTFTMQGKPITQSSPKPNFKMVNELPEGTPTDLIKSQGSDIIETTARKIDDVGTDLVPSSGKFLSKIDDVAGKKGLMELLESGAGKIGSALASKPAKALTGLAGLLLDSEPTATTEQEVQDRAKVLLSEAKAMGVKGLPKLSDIKTENDIYHLQKAMVSGNQGLAKEGSSEPMMSKMTPQQMAELQKMEAKKAQDIVENPYIAKKEEETKTVKTPVSPKKLKEQEKRDSELLLKELDKLREGREGAETKDVWLTLAKGLLDASAYYSAANPYSSKNKVLKTEMPTNIGASQLETRRKELMDLLRATQASEDRAEDRLFRQGQMDLSKQKFDLAKKAAEAKTEQKEQKLTKGEEAIDQAFGKKYAEYMDNRGDIEVNRQKLKGVLDALESGKMDTGFLTGAQTRIGEVAGFKTKAAEMKDEVRSAIQGMLRPTLGAQFAEKEGERIINVAFDPARSEEANKKALRDEIKKLDSRVKSFQERADHFGNKGTLKGYSPSKSVTKSTSFPMTVVNPETGMQATVNNEKELKEAKSEGFE